MPIDRPWVVFRNVHHLRIYRRQHDIALIVVDRLLRRAAESSSSLRALAHYLNGLQQVLWLVVVGVAQFRGPLQVVIHLRQYLRKCSKRLYAGVPGLRSAPAAICSEEAYSCARRH